MQIDPLTDDYTELTPYQYAGNDPITNIDEDGLAIGDGVTLAECVVKNTHRVHLAAEIVTQSGKWVNIGESAFKLGAKLVAVQVGHVVKFDKTAIDLDGARSENSPYTKTNEGTDKLGNAYDNGDPSTGNLVGGYTDPKTGDPIYQKDFPDANVSTTSVAKYPKLKNEDPNRYYDSEKDDFIATNPDLTKAGIQLKDYVNVTRVMPNGESITVKARSVDTGPSHYKIKGKDGKWHGHYVKGTLEMSIHLFQKIGITLEKVIPKGTNSRTGKPFKTAKYKDPPNANLEVIKIKP